MPNLSNKRELNYKLIDFLMMKSKSDPEFFNQMFDATLDSVSAKSEIIEGLIDCAYNYLKENIPYPVGSIIKVHLPESFMDGQQFVVWEVAYLLPDEPESWSEAGYRYRVLDNTGNLSQFYTIDDAEIISMNETLRNFINPYNELKFYRRNHA